MVKRLQGILRKAPRESAIERFIGWLTIAVGAGVLIPAARVDGTDFVHYLRWSTSIVAVVIGTTLITATYIPNAIKVRIILLAVAIAVWLTLVIVLASGGFWPAALQAGVIVAFANDAGFRLWRNRRA